MRRQADAQEEVEVTPAMVSAGLAALFPSAEFRAAADEAEVMARVFRAMEMSGPGRVGEAES